VKITSTLERALTAGTWPAGQLACKQTRAVALAAVSCCNYLMQLVALPILLLVCTVGCSM
jgi:hypothetical protein